MMIGRQSDHRDVTCGESAPISELSPSRYSKSVAGATHSSRELILPAMDVRHESAVWFASRGKKPTPSNKSSTLHFASWGKKI